MSTPALIEIDSSVSHSKLGVSISYSEIKHTQATITQFGTWFIQELENIIAHCISEGATRHLTPSDFPDAELSQDELNKVLATRPQDTVSNLFALSPLQKGLLFQTLLDEGQGQYTNQLVCIMQTVLLLCCCFVTLLIPGSSASTSLALWMRNNSRNPSNSWCNIMPYCALSLCGAT